MNLETSFKRVFPDNWVINSQSQSEFLIRDQNLPPREGYLISVSLELNSLVAKIYFESYSKDLLDLVLAKITSSIESIKHFIEGFNSISFITRKTVLDENFSLKFERTETIEFEIYFKLSSTPYSIESFFEVLFSFILIVFPYETEGELEGESSFDESIRYERNKLNRSMCLAFHGYNCKACGIDMQSQYGDVASKFIHVHHVVPVSTLNNSRIDPIKDLVPLCPNCHAIAHLRNPPYTINEIISMLKK
jgi:hypothetical protein